MSGENSSPVAFAEAILWHGLLLVALILILSSCEWSGGGELSAQESPVLHEIMLGRPCDEIYVVREGETLQTISDKCGDPHIVEENPHIHDPDDVFPGLVIKITPSRGVQGSAHQYHDGRGHNHRGDYGFRPTKLFVFGDSYADTGNLRKTLANSWSWNIPYGITFPGKPAGRFSDGRVLTDYVAKSLGLKTPIAYARRKIGAKKLWYGMNFAFGGSGVFDTWALLMLPNMTTQIDFFENLVNESVYTKWDLESSVVLVSLAGNDYAAFLQNGGTIQGLQGFIPRVVNQLAVNLKRISEFEARKIVVTALQPLGCLPRITQLTSFQQCNTTQNTAVQFHNLLLRQAVAKLNNETKRSNIFVLDLYDSFTTILDQKNDLKGKLKFESPLKPCCMGTCAECSCGSLDDKGKKLYTVCSDPKSAFFWDSSHPTQAGWRAVYTTLKSGVEQFVQIQQL